MICDLHFTWLPASYYGKDFVLFMNMYEPLKDTCMLLMCWVLSNWLGTNDKQEVRRHHIIELTFRFRKIYNEPKINK